MLLLIHIVIALGSVLGSTASAIFPSKAKFNTTIGLVILTFITGSYLVLSTHSSLVSSCILGLVYLAIAISGVFVGTRRLAYQKVRIKK